LTAKNGKKKKQHLTAWSNWMKLNSKGEKKQSKKHGMTRGGGFLGSIQKVTTSLRIFPGDREYEEIDRGKDIEKEITRLGKTASITKLLPGTSPSVESGV